MVPLLSEGHAKTTAAGGAQQPPAGAVSHAPNASPPALRKLGVEVQGRVDEYLVRVDTALARRRATAAQRRAVGVSVRNKIMERLAARANAQQGTGLSAQDAEAVLAELGAPQRHADEAVPPRPADEKFGGRKSLSTTAVMGMCWAAMLPVMILLMKTPMSVMPDESPPWWHTVLQMVVIPLGWSALIATPVLGWLALDQIRKSKRRLYGKSLAMFDMLVFPLLLLDYGIFWASWQLAGTLVEQQAIGESVSKLITQVLPTVACVLGDYFIAAWAWTWVSDE